MTADGGDDDDDDDEGTVYVGTLLWVGVADSRDC